MLVCACSDLHASLCAQWTYFITSNTEFAPMPLCSSLKKTLEKIPLCMHVYMDADASCGGSLGEDYSVLGF